MSHERLPVLSAAVALNAIGMALSTAFPTILYLDMIGTALAALLLGPWYGAIAACLSSGLINYALFPNTPVLPWMLVNVTGAMFWGAMGSMTWFREGGSSMSPSSHMMPMGPSSGMTTILIGGVMAAVILAIPGTITQMGMGPRYLDSFSLDKGTAELIRSLQSAIKAVLDDMPFAARAEQIGIDSHWLSTYAVNVIRYVPDKVLTILLAVLCIRAMYPVHWDLLIISRKHHAHTFMLPRQPLLFALVYITVIWMHHVFSFGKSDPAAPDHTLAYLITSRAILVFASLCCLFGIAGGIVGRTEVSEMCTRARVYEQIATRADAEHEHVIDQRGVFKILVSVMLFSIVFFVLMKACSPLEPNHPAIDSASTAFRGMSALVMCMIFLLKFAKAAAVQQRAKVDLGEFKRAAWSSVEADLRLLAAQDAQDVVSMATSGQQHSVGWEQVADLAGVGPLPPPSDNPSATDVATPGPRDASAGKDGVPKQGEADPGMQPPPDNADGSIRS